MTHAREMLDTHPRASDVDAARLAEAIDAIADCAQTCTACADACLGEGQLDMLRRCIRFNLDCADACTTAVRVLSRRTEADAAVVRAVVEACAAACVVCGDECEQHAEMHEHCKICAESCRRCAAACDDVREILGV